MGGRRAKGSQSISKRLPYTLKITTHGINQLIGKRDQKKRKEKRRKGE